MSQANLFLCGGPYSAAVIPHFHVGGRENSISVVITLRANQTDYFSISDGYISANRKLGFLRLVKCIQLLFTFPKVTYTVS